MGCRGSARNGSAAIDAPARAALFLSSCAFKADGVSAGGGAFDTPTGRRNLGGHHWASAKGAQITSNINAVTGDGGEVVLEKAALQELSDSLRGNLLLTGSEAYEKARSVINKSIDKYPALCRS